MDKLKTANYWPFLKMDRIGMPACIKLENNLIQRTK